jgi:integrase
MTLAQRLGVNPFDGIDFFATARHPTYTDEDPNSLNASQLSKFMADAYKRYPQHYGMMLLGFCTGKRPSTLRPLRKSGDEADVDWDIGRITFRRSHTIGHETMEGVKTGGNEYVYLPEFVMSVLREHDLMIQHPPINRRGKAPMWWREPMRDSLLLFPGRDNDGMRSSSCLDKPFADISRRIGLPFIATPRSMRRTFNDLARAAQVNDFVIRSITGHETEDMQDHYSTAQADEQRQAIAKVVQLFNRTGT